MIEMVVARRGGVVVGMVCDLSLLAKRQCAQLDVLLSDCQHTDQEPKKCACWLQQVLFWACEVEQVICK